MVGRSNAYCLPQIQKSGNGDLASMHGSWSRIANWIASSLDFPVTAPSYNPLTIIHYSVCSRIPVHLSPKKYIYQKISAHIRIIC